ncbi:MAG: glycosyltransferase 87 family protein [Janthinobacterium lividum]
MAGCRQHTLTVTTKPAGRGFWPATAVGTNLALAFLGCILLGLSHHLALEFDDFIIGYSETTICALAVFLGSAVIVTRQPVDRWTLPIILVFGVLCRLVLLTPDPHLSSDIYRYVWDGMMQHHGISPYRFVPGDVHLKMFREDDIFPNINRRDYAPTIYPPIAQMFFYAATGLSFTLVAMKLAFYAAEAVAVWALLKALPLVGMRREQVLLYAWSPLLIWEIGSSGHVDALLAMFVSLAILYRLRNQPVLTGLALGAAVMTKFYPLLLLPALYRRGDRRMPLAMLAVIVGGYACYAGVGKRVFGFAGGYVAEEGMANGSRYFLLDLLQHVRGFEHVPIWAFFLFCAACFAPVLLWCWRCNERPGGAFLAPAGTLAFLLMLLFSPHYPWYVIWLVPFLVLRPNLTMGVYVCAIFYGLTTQWSEPGAKLFFLQKWVYGATALAFVLQWTYARWLRPIFPLDRLFPRTDESGV